MDQNKKEPLTPESSAVLPEKDYKEAYEQEHYKSTYLAGRVAELEDKVDDLQFKLDRIKNNPVWKASTPLRKGMHFCIRQVDRVKNCGSIGGVVTKLKYKSNERKAMKHYGTESFPSQEERKKQEETVFPRMVKISILTPLEYAGEFPEGNDWIRTAANLWKLGTLPG